MRLTPAARIALCALLPVVGVVELALAEGQKRAVATDADWHAAAVAAKDAKKPGDMILVAPRWAEPLGRKAIGEVDKSLIDFRMVGRADLDTVAHAIELSIRGDDDPQTKGWKLVEERRFGAVKLRVLANPKPEKLVRDLVEEVGPDTPAVKLPLGPDGAPAPGVAPIEKCRWDTGPSKIPNMAQGPGLPTSRWLCPPYDPNWTFVAPTVLTDLEYAPRRCVFLHPTDHATAIDFPPRLIGKKVVGHVGLQVFTERDVPRSPVHARVEIAGKEVAHGRHQDGDGFLRFEGTTAEFAGQSQPVRIVTWAEGTPQFRVACVAAELRE